MQTQTWLLNYMYIHDTDKYNSTVRAIKSDELLDIISNRFLFLFNQSYSWNVMCI